MSKGLKQFNPNRKQVAIVTDDENEFLTWVDENGKPDEVYCIINDENPVEDNDQFYRVIKIKGHQNVPIKTIQLAQQKSILTK